MRTWVDHAQTEAKHHDQPPSAAVQNLDKEVKPLQGVLKKFSHDWSTNLAAALAYNLLLTTVPVVAAMLAILGFVLARFGGDASTFVTTVLTGTLPHSQAFNAGGIVQAVQQNPALLAQLPSSVIAPGSSAREAAGDERKVASDGR